MRYLTLADLQQPFDYAQLFAAPAPVELEIGMGRGDFLIDYAADHPETNFIGIERNLAILRRAVTKLERSGMSNVVLLNAEITYLCENYFPGHSLQAIHVYFPDPWPKRRHANRRLFKPGAAELFARLLEPAGFLHLRTDVAGYFQTMLELIGKSPAFRPIEPPTEITQIRTAFEKRYVLSGKPIYRASYQVAT